MTQDLLSFGVLILWAASVASATEVVVLEEEMRGVVIGAALEIAEDPGVGGTSDRS
jgi:hypothetical protein